MKKIIAYIIAFTGIGTAAMAQTTNVQNSSLLLSDVVEVTFVSTGTATGSVVSLPFTNATNYTNGVTSSAQQLKVTSNRNFNVTVKTNAANFTYSGSKSPAPVMPVNSVLGLKVTSNSTGGTIASGFSSSYGMLSSTNQNMITNCTRGGSQNFSVTYFANPGFTYPEGAYTINVIYTTTQL